MVETFNIDEKTRFLVLYFDARMDIKQISKIINRKETTLKIWETKTKNGEDIRIKKKIVVTKLKITADVENKVIQMLKENPEGASTTKIATRVGISPFSVARILTKKGYKYKAIEHGIEYSEDERIARVNFCKNMLFEGGNIIYRTFFSDEMGIDLNKNHKHKVWQTPTEKVKRKSLIERVKLNCWGAISAQGATSLDIYDTSMNGDVYRQVIRRHRAEMENLYPDGEFHFMQDNHPAHKVNEEWIVKDQKINLIKLPKRSPDLNIIENLWAALKERVTCDAPTNEKELRASLTHNWELLTNADRLQPFFEGLHRRYLECITKGGKKLPY